MPPNSESTFVLFVCLTLPFAGAVRDCAAQASADDSSPKAAAAVPSIPASPPRLELVNRPVAPDQQPLIMEPGRVEFRVHTPKAHRAWLCYEPDAGEILRYFLGSAIPDPIVPWIVEAATGGKFYVAVENESDRMTYSGPLRVVSAPYEAIERGLSPDPQVRIEVNLPAFELSLYRGNTLLQRFHVGIGLREWPVPAGLRAAHALIWNPKWSPPNSPWATPALVRKLRARGEVLGRMKIPLGGEVLIHGTSRRSDLGRTVSHGCIRMLNSDVEQLGLLLIRETGATIRTAELQRAHSNHNFSFRTALPRPVLVAIRYDPVVLRDGKLSVYPDVYGWAPVSAVQVAEARAFAEPQPAAVARTKPRTHSATPTHNSPPKHATRSSN